MILPIRELIDTLAAPPKTSLGNGDFSRRVYFRAKAGESISFATAQRLLGTARTANPDVIGLRMADGTVIYHVEALAQLAERNSSLEREVALLRLQLMRKIVGGSTLHCEN